MYSFKTMLLEQPKQFCIEWHAIQLVQLKFTGTIMVHALSGFFCIDKNAFILNFFELFKPY